MILVQIFVTVDVLRNEDRRDSAESVAAEEVKRETYAPNQPVCPDCGWTKPYSNISSARKGLAAHRQRCQGADAYKNPFSEPVDAQAIEYSMVAPTVRGVAASHLSPFSRPVKVKEQA